MTATVLVASILMIASGVAKRRLGWRTTQCPVCHHERRACTCRWL